jgi:hypothetical protein
MKRLYDPIWIAVAVVLSIVVVIAGYPVFQEKYGFPISLFWTLACVAGVWLTYVIRAHFWGLRR